MIVEYSSGFYGLESDEFELKTQEELLEEMKNSGEWDELLGVLRNG